MRPASVVVDSPLFDNHPQMAFVEWDQEIHTLPPKTAPETFAEGIRRRRPDWTTENSHSQLGDRLVQFLGKDAVPVVEHESVRMIAGQVSRNCGRVHSAVGWAVTL